MPKPRNYIMDGDRVLIFRLHFLPNWKFRLVVNVSRMKCWFDLLRRAEPISWRTFLREKGISFSRTRIMRRVSVAD
jgi:hypothetical protein